MEEAERIAREEHGSIKLAVISGGLHFVRWWVLLLTFSLKVWARETTIEN
jgi:hypothetical protein